MDTMTLGNVDITRAVELPPRGLPRDLVFPDVPMEHWRANESWLAPEFLDLAADEVRTMIQPWVGRRARRPTLIDTGIGNARERPHMPPPPPLDPDFLGELAAAGVRPED